MSDRPEQYAYVVLMEGVHRSELGGVFTDLDAATIHAQAMADDSDGWHTFRVVEVALDEPIWAEPRWKFGFRRDTARVIFTPYAEDDGG